MKEEIRELITKAYVAAHQSPELNINYYNNVDVKNLNDSMVKVRVLLEDACDTMEETEKESEWISIKDELPSPCGSVLVFCPKGAYMNTYVASYSQKTFHTGCDVVTHWMPLPLEPPEKDQ